MRAAVAVGLTAAGLMALAAAQAHEGGAPHDHPTNDQIIAARQAAYKLMGADFGGLRAAVARGDDVKPLAFPAGAIAAWAKAMPGMFPKRVTNATTKALPAIDSGRAGFEAAAARLDAAATRLAELAKAGDQPGFAAQLGELGAACKGCHDKYRAPDK